MKKTLLLALCAMPGFIFAQEKWETSPTLRADRDITIWSEDFQNGIPSDWSNTESGNIASWEYRGPSTTPDLTIGSRGSCTINFIGEAIQSTTSSNGFIIFDSNYWDNDALPCTPENMGTSQNFSAPVLTPGRDGCDSTFRRFLFLCPTTLPSPRPTPPQIRRRPSESLSHPRANNPR